MGGARDPEPSLPNKDSVSLGHNKNVFEINGVVYAALRSFCKFTKEGKDSWTQRTGVARELS